MSTLADAIAIAEGYGQPGAIPTAANNPGDLALGDIGYGTMGQGITVFPTQQAGQAALDNQLSLIQSGGSQYYSPNETISQMGNTWSGGNPDWANNVASALGVSPNTPINSLSQNSSGGLNMGGFWNSLKQAFGGGNLSQSDIQAWNAAGQSAKQQITGSGIPARAAAFIVGVIAIGVGLLMFKQTQTIIKTAGKAAEIAAG